MFGPVWPVKQWAGLGAVIGAVFQLVQVINLGQFANGYAFASGRILGGMVLGAFFGAMMAFIRNQAASRR
jgi:ABC-type Fe3+-siderophore transport system permease subunit